MVAPSLAAAVSTTVQEAGELALMVNLPVVLEEVWYSPLKPVKSQPVRVGVAVTRSDQLMAWPTDLAVVSRVDFLLRLTVSVVPGSSVNLTLLAFHWA